MADRFLLDTIQVQATAPTAVVGAVATVVAAGDSLTSKDAQEAMLLPAFGHHQVTGVLEITAPSFQDNNNGIRSRNIAAQVYPLWPLTRPIEKIGRLDTMVVRFSGSAVGGQIETAVLPVLYRNPAQQNAGTLISPQDLVARGTGLYTTVVSTHVGGVVGGYSAPVLLNAAGNIYNLIGGKQYALVGAYVDTVCAAITLRGPGTGQARVAIPGNPNDRDMAANYFLSLSYGSGLPCIPVISSLDSGVTTCEVVCNQAGGTFIATWIFQLLK